jgi:hypothetical protein
MKQKQTAPLALTALLIIALVPASCGNISAYGSAEPRITVYGGSSPSKVGETLRASSSGAEFTRDSDFIWEYSDKREGVNWHEIRTGSLYYGYYGTVSGENDKEFTIGEGLADFYLRVRRQTKATDNTQSVWVYSDIVGRIQSAK